MVDRLILAFGIFAGLLVAVTIPFDELHAARCDCDCEGTAARIAEQHKLAWGNVHDGTPLDDAELQALADAQSIVECVARGRDGG